MKHKLHLAISLLLALSAPPLCKATLPDPPKVETIKSERFYYTTELKMTPNPAEASQYKSQFHYTASNYTGYPR
jgi:hypothetical protein